MCTENEWYEEYLNKKNKNKLKKYICKDVNFMSRFKFKEVFNNNLINDNYCIISISDTVNECNEIKDLIGGNLNNLCIYIKDNADHYDDDIYDIISNFIIDNIDKKFIIHCFQGINRSAGVAKAIIDYKKINDKYMNNYIEYNKALHLGVYKKLNNVDI